MTEGQLPQFHYYGNLTTTPADAPYQPGVSPAKPAADDGRAEVYAELDEALHETSRQLEALVTLRVPHHLSDVATLLLTLLADRVILDSPCRDCIVELDGVLEDAKMVCADLFTEPIQAVVTTILTGTIDKIDRYLAAIEVGAALLAHN